MRSDRSRLVTSAVLLSLLACATPAAADELTAPRPTSTAASPQAPDPHPPAGGPAPDGSVPGGPRLAGRGLLVPAGSARLPTSVHAAAWVLADLDSGQILAARDPHGRYQPASILKILTAVTVLPRLPGRRTVVVSPTAAGAEGSAVGLLAGARYSVDELFQALLLVSGNDAAAALAEAYGGTAATVTAMNATARRLGAYDTLVQTPSGLDGWQQLTSAYDMCLFLRAAVAMPRLLAYDQLPRAFYPPRASKHGKVGVYEFDNQSSDFFATVPGALLAKTGYTDAARHTYLAAAQRHGRRLGVVLLRDERVPVDEYRQAAALFDWGFARPTGADTVGRLAGPIGALTAAGQAAPKLAAESSAAPRPRARVLQAAVSRPYRPWPAGWGSAVSLLFGAVALAAVARRARRRRGPRPR